LVTKQKTSEEHLQCKKTLQGFNSAENSQ